VDQGRTIGEARARDLGHGAASMPWNDTHFPRSMAHLPATVRVKAIAIARGFVAPNGIDLVAVPGFQDIAIGGEERTAIKFIIGSR